MKTKLTAGLVGLLAGLVFSTYALGAISIDTPTFNQPSGFALYDGGNYDFGHAMATQQDGKIVVAGGRSNGINNDILVLRFHSGGSLDKTFGSGGVVTYDSGDDDYAYAVAIQADGRIVVAGGSYNGDDYDITVLRLNDDGTLDGTFGSAGVAVYDGENDFGYGMAIQADGRIVVVGGTYKGTSSDALMVRFQSNGALDNTFGAAGAVTYNGGGHDYAHAVAIQADGKIVVVGESSNGMDCDILVLRLLSNGSTDNGFGIGGIVKYNSGDDECGYAVAALADGRIIVTGCLHNGINCDALIMRLNANGSIDKTFGTGGIAVYDRGYDELAYAAAVQPDGKIAVAGSVFDGVNSDGLVLRFNASGTLDNTFGAGGYISYVIGNNVYGSAVALQPDGKIIVAGTSDNGTDYDVFVLRLAEIQMPDLVVSSIAALAWRAGTNLTALTVSFRVKNQSSAGAAPSTVKFYLSRDMILGGSDIYLGSAAIASLAAGRETALGTMNFRISVPASGAWYILGVADANDEVVEGNETNNAKGTIVTVK